MKPFLHLTLPNGMVFEIPTQVVADNRAKAMLEAHPDEFKNLPEAMEDTVGLFTDDSWNIQDWAANNMNWSDLQNSARMIRFTPPDMSEWNNGEFSYHDHPGMLGEVDGDSIMRQPLELTLNVMAASSQVCNVSLLGNDNGQPFAAVAVMIGDATVLQPFIIALQHVAGQIAGTSQAAPAPQH